MSMVPPRTVYLVASGDLRPAANRTCWPAQAEMEAALGRALAAQGWQVQRAHPYDEKAGHGFIDAQRRGMDVFRGIPPEVPLIVAEAVWQYSHHVLAGLITHRGPILTVANWSGQWPGLVGLLNLNASLTKAEVRYSTLWSEDFTDDFFCQGLRAWLETGAVAHDSSHVHPLPPGVLSLEDETWARTWAQEFRHQKAILGVFDEGCMGMFNAIVPDALLHGTGCFKERLSQSTLYAAMQEVPLPEAHAVLNWLRARGLHLELGQDEVQELTEAQVLAQCQMYIAAVRLADEFGCDAIGIQYQQGLKDLAPASDLVEGMLNNVERPPVRSADGTRELYAGEALPHFNEVDECAGLDGLITYQLWRALGWAPENTLHDLRWAAAYEGEDVWVLLISGAAPPAHFIGGWQGASSERQPAMYFRLGGGTLKGISKPGHIVWSRIYVAEGALHADLGTARVVELPPAETERRWQETTPQWPIMHAAFDGVSRNQMMAQHKSNHIQVVYVPDAAAAERGALLKATVLAELGLHVHLCGTVGANR